MSIPRLDMPRTKIINWFQNSTISYSDCVGSPKGTTRHQQDDFIFDYLSQFDSPLLMLLAIILCIIFIY